MLVFLGSIDGFNMFQSTFTWICCLFFQWEKQCPKFPYIFFWSRPEGWNEGMRGSNFLFPKPLLKTQIKEGSFTLLETNISPLSIGHPVDGWNLAPLGCMKPYKWWDKLPINWCRISAINSPKKEISSSNYPFSGWASFREGLCLGRFCQKDALLVLLVCKISGGHIQAIQKDRWISVETTSPFWF